MRKGEIRVNLKDSVNAAYGYRSRAKDVSSCEVEGSKSEDVSDEVTYLLSRCGQFLFKRQMCTMKLLILCLQSFKPGGELTD